MPSAMVVWRTISPTRALPRRMSPSIAPTTAPRRVSTRRPQNSPPSGLALADDGSPSARRNLRVQGLYGVRQRHLYWCGQVQGDLEIDAAGAQVHRGSLTFDMHSLTVLLTS